MALIAVFALTALFLIMLAGCTNETPTTDDKFAEGGKDILLDYNNVVLLDGNFNAWVIDVGQGDSILLEFPGKEFMLVDTGKPEAADAIWEVLEKKGATDLDFLVLTHPHADHIGSVEALIEKGMQFDYLLESDYPCDTQTCSLTEDAIAKVPHEKIDFKVGDRLKTNIPVIILNPSIKTYASNTNDASIVLMVQHGQVRMLLMGDCEFDCEKNVMKDFSNLWANILKVGHHGSKTSSGKEFLNLIKPKSAVVSNALNNTFGHPAKETLDRLIDSGAVVYRTDTSGTVKITSDGKNYTVLTDKSGWTIELNNPSNN